MTHQISKARAEDHYSLSKIAFEAKSYWGYPAEWLEIWKPDLTIAPGLITDNDSWKITIEDEIIGFTIIITHPNGSCEVEHCWISPDYIGKGYGGKLLRHVLAQPQYAQKRFNVLADPNPVPFYQKFGFKTLKEIPGKPEGRNLPWMEMVNQSQQQLIQ